MCCSLSLNGFKLVPEQPFGFGHSKGTMSLLNCS